VSLTTDCVSDVEETEVCSITPFIASGVVGVNEDTVTEEIGVDSIE